MTLSFPNGSRSYDPRKNLVRFWGYDSTIEISFFVKADALQMLSPDMSDAEAGILQAFDAARERMERDEKDIAERERKGAEFAEFIKANPWVGSWNRRIFRLNTQNSHRYMKRVGLPKDLQGAIDKTIEQIPQLAGILYVVGERIESKKPIAVLGNYQHHGLCLSIHKGWAAKVGISHPPARGWTDLH